MSTSVRPEPATAPPPFPAALLPDAYDADQIKAPTGALKSISRADAGFAPDATHAGLTVPNPMAKPLTGIPRILTQYIAEPLMDHPVMSVLAATVRPVAWGMMGLMGKDVTEYVAQKTAELSLPKHERMLAEQDPGRISGEQAAVEAAMLGAVPIARGVIKRAAGEVPKVTPTDAVPEGPTTDPVARAQTAVKAHVARVADSWRKLFSPASRTPESGAAANILRATTGEAAGEYEQQAFKLDEFRRAIEPLSDADKLGFIDAIEGGRSQPTPEFEEAATAIRTTLDQAWKDIHDLGPGHLDNYLKNYFPHVWTDPERAAEVFKNFRKSSSLEGTEAFRKEREIPTTADGLAFGLTPASMNPVDLTMMKVREMQRYLMAHSALTQMQGADLVRYVGAGELPPDGYQRIDDKIATVFGPREGAVRFPEGAMVPGEEVAKNLPVSIRDKTGKLRRSLSKVTDTDLEDEWRRLAELNQSEEALHSSVKESGYRENYEELPRTERLGAVGQEDLPDADGEMDPDVLAGHNQIIKDYNRSQIVRAAREKAMSRIEREMASRPAANEFQVGVNMYRTGGGIPGMRLMQQGDVTVPGIRIMGQYYAPEPVARVVNNYLSPGLRGDGMYDFYRGIGNTLNQAQLGLSAFHLGFTSLDATVSRLALGLEYIAGGDAVEGLKHIVSAPAAPFGGITQGLGGDLVNHLFGTDIQIGLGAKIRAAYLNPSAASDDYIALANAVREAGGRVRQDSFYHNSAVERMVTAWRAGEYGKSTALSLPAFFEAVSKPILEHVVPLQKLGVFGEMARKVLAELPEDAPLAERRAQLAKAWDSVDNRMGQLVYDNLFWNKTFKDLAMASVRSVGWNIGTIRELGGGIGDLAGAGKDLAAQRAAVLTHRAAYVIALPLTAGFYGAVYQYTRTGEGPQELKDYFFPKTGELDANGNPERVQIASYMKDIIAYRDHPFATVQHKLSPLLSMVYDMLENSDFYGDEIRNPNDPAVKQIGQEAAFILKQATPFSLRNMTEATNRGDQSAVTKFGNWFGITPAPRDKVRSDAQNRMADYLSQRRMSGATPEDAEARQSRAEILAGLRGNSGIDLNQAVTDAIERHQITAPEVVALLKRAGSTPMQENFKRLTVAQAIDVFKLSTPREKSLFAEALLSKIERAQTRSHD